MVDGREVGAGEGPVHQQVDGDGHGGGVRHVVVHVEVGEGLAWASAWEPTWGGGSVCALLSGALAFLFIIHNYVHKIITRNCGII